MTEIYLISPPSFRIATFKKELDQALSAGKVGCFQLRMKDYDVLEVAGYAKELLPICREYGVPFIINDYYELARDISFDGIHIGQDDGDIRSLRKEFPEKFLGISCQNSHEKALKGVNDGADYVAFGAFFPTLSKENVADCKLDVLREWKKLEKKIKTVAIGGINENNIEIIAKEKPDYIAMITAIWNYSGGPGVAIRILNEKIK